MHADTKAYNAAQGPGDRKICDLLAKEIDRALPEADNKVWHAHPVWFLEGNPIVGYSKLKDSVRLLFWSGQSFDEELLHKEGKFQAAEARYTAVSEVDTKDLARWLAKARDIQWDYKNIVKRKWRLERLDVAPKSAASKPSKKAGKTAAPAKTDTKVKLLSGGNPQIPKGDGDAPVRDYIAAMPGWKQEVGLAIDRLVAKNVPGVQRAVRWNTPFYGVKGNGWFLCFHCMTKYVKVTLFRGTSLKPIPPETSKVEEVRYLHIHEGEPIDEKQLADWIRQAAALPGERCF